MKKANDYEYEIDTAGLGGKMFFSGGSSCGHIKSGVEFRLSIMRGGWVVPLSEIWQMAFIATIKAAEQSVQRTIFKASAERALQSANEAAQMLGVGKSPRA